MDFNKLAQEINQINQEKGWNDLDRRPLEIIALIHSEISEATEQWLHNKPNVWYGEDGKPEGFYVELIDAFIRTLGYLGYNGYEITSEYSDDEDVSDFDDAEYCAYLNMQLSKATEEYRLGLDFNKNLLEFAFCIYDYFVNLKLEGGFEKLLREKIEYNKTRPYRHGNKEA